MIAKIGRILTTNKKTSYRTLWINFFEEHMEIWHSSPIPSRLWLLVEHPVAQQSNLRKKTEIADDTKDMQLTADSDDEFLDF